MIERRHYALYTRVWSYSALQTVLWASLPSQSPLQTDLPLKRRHAHLHRVSGNHTAADHNEANETGKLFVWLETAVCWESHHWMCSATSEDILGLGCRIKCACHIVCLAFFFFLCFPAKLLNSEAFLRYKCDKKAVRHVVRGCSHSLCALKPFHVCSIRDQEFALGSIGLQNRLLNISLLKHSAKWLPVHPINTYDHKCIQSKNTTMQVYMWHPVQIKIIYSPPLYLMISCHNLIGRTMFIELQSIAFHIWSCV